MAFKYKIYDNSGKMIGDAFSDDAPTSPVWRMILAQADAQVIIAEKNVKVVIPDAENDPIEGEVISSNGSIVTIKGVRVRENLRMPVKFSTYIYPIDDSWKGRSKIIGNDLSCGGFAFFSERELKVDEVVETVLPITSRPLILRLKILRTRQLNDGRLMYAAEFHEMLHEEETMIRETVFRLQVHYVPDDN